MIRIECYVEIVEVKTNKVVKRLGPMSPSKAERVENGIITNLSPHYYTRITPKV